MIVQRMVHLVHRPLHDQATQLHRPRNKAIECAGLTHTISKRNVLTLRVPRSCLDDPRWVRAGARVVSSDKPMQYWYADQAHRKADSRARTIRVGPRLRVG